MNLGNNLTATPGSSAICIWIVGGNISLLELLLTFYSMGKRSETAIDFCFFDKCSRKRCSEAVISHNATTYAGVSCLSA